MSATPQAIAATKALEAVMRQDRGRLMAALVARLGSFQRAEDALQEAAISALSHWGRSGLPHAPQGWLLRVALRKAIDRLRGDAREGRKAAELAKLSVEEAADLTPEEIGDERLRLIFTCCHPALEQKSQVALTLRCLGGVSTAEIARLFLDAEPTMGQRLSRAKAKIVAAGIPFAVPEPEDWPARLQAVLTVIYLIFTTGHGMGPGQTRDLCEEAIFLARMLDQLRPGDPEIEGAVALLLVTHARRDARLSGDGTAVALAAQDRRLWRGDEIAEGLLFLDRAMARGAPGAFQIKAAIAACHGAEGGSDWRQIEALYRSLLRHEATPVVRLNHAVACAEAWGVEHGLPLIEALDGALAEYQPYHAARAEYLARAGRTDESRSAYRRAIALCHSSADAAFLAKRLSMLP